MSTAKNQLEVTFNKSFVLFLIPLVLIGPLSMDMYLPALAFLQGYFRVSESLV